ncbi:CotH kinase family protein [Snuella sedimenti]|uniref:CotH kinase family protein n=1 Tax=Snuella sedimenti TaxID=2798802 RepID=A0A8J7LN66_9FLAO|nr:CotH kinase family protein [Snuella sedimenti]MBJ6367483.1 CotH kinase family protein [Snuella sedimenti]
MKQKLQCYKLLVLGCIFLQILGCEKDNVSEDVVSNETTEQESIDYVPKVKINTHGSTIIDEPKINASIEIDELGTITFKGNIGIELRGATSQSFPKKSYGFETWDANNNDLNVSFLGFPEEEDWILQGPYSDKTLFRNVLMYDLSREMGRYASKTLFVELYINNTNQGIYVLMEKLKRDKNRIAVNKLNPDENTGEGVTGGYILKIDKLAGSNLGSGYNEANSFKSEHVSVNTSGGQDVYFLYEYPKPEYITPEQKTYIKTYVNQFEDALASNAFKDTQLGYAAYIDTASFIDFLLLNELANNVDAYRLSTFMSKDINGKLKMGPIWDFNLGLGNADYCNGDKTNTWAYQFNDHCPQYGNVPFWWGRLLQDPAFVSQLKARWNELRGSTLSESFISSKIEGYVTLLKTSGALDSNFQIWNVMGTYVWPNSFVGSDYNDEVNFLKQWIHERLLWMDGAIQNL